MASAFSEPSTEPRSFFAPPTPWSQCVSPGAIRTSQRPRYTMEVRGGNSRGRRLMRKTILQVHA